MSVSNSALTSVLWDKLLSIFQGEMNVGPTGAGTGTNVTGRLQTVLGINRSIAIGNAFPALGVQLKSIEYEFSGSSRQNFTAVFMILIAVVAAIDPATNLVLLDDAMQQLGTIQDDGQGNGIEPILLDPANYQLGSTFNVLTTLLKRWEYAWEDPAATDSEPRAYAVATFEVRGQVKRR